MTQGAELEARVHVTPAALVFPLRVLDTNHLRIFPSVLLRYGKEIAIRDLRLVLAMIEVKRATSADSDVGIQLQERSSEESSIALWDLMDSNYFQIRVISTTSKSFHQRPDLLCWSSTLTCRRRVLLLPQTRPSAVLHMVLLLGQQVEVKKSCDGASGCGRRSGNMIVDSFLGGDSPLPRCQKTLVSERGRRWPSYARQSLSWCSTV